MRRNFSPKILEQAYERSNGLCEMVTEGVRCNAPLRPGRWRCDHVIPDGLGGEPTLANAQAICLGCDGEKTPQDIKRIAKAKRVKRRSLGIKKASKFRGWRKFDGTLVKNPNYG